MDPIQDVVECCCVGIEVKDGGVGLSNNLRDGGSRPISKRTEINSDGKGHRP